MNDDLISRQATINTTINMRNRCDDINDFYDLLIESFKVLPSAEPKKGKWVQTNPPERSDNIVCDQCGYDSIAKFIYCPNCGSKMGVTK